MMMDGPIGLNGVTAQVLMKIHPTLTIRIWFLTLYLIMGIHYIIRWLIPAAAGMLDPNRACIIGIQRKISRI